MNKGPYMFLCFGLLLGLAEGVSALVGFHVVLIVGAAALTSVFVEKQFDKNLE